ncbi:hypothetical protein [Acidisphaera sp. L21]|jgi:hypothetical protein|uniref:hypothetical protein n=1 Tax=Acidisphaera sp. L21 TaxID=1641851 RepID=UPI00131C4073|nr:hypothetical protein [Acidisphaera sp. L21]
MDSAAALAAIDDDAIAEAAAAGLLAGSFKDEDSQADAVLVRYLMHAVALARAIPARALSKYNATVDSFTEQLREDDADDGLEECVDDLIVLAIGPIEGHGVPDETATEAAVLRVEAMTTAAMRSLFKTILKPERSFKN